MKRIRFILVAMLIAAYAMIAPSSAKPGSAPGTVGKYDVVFAGRYTGNGTVHVNGAGKLVNFKGTIKDEKTGAVGTFDAATPPLNLDNGRFTGPGNALGQAVTICGRVEPPDGRIVLKARFICTFSGGTGSGIGGTRAYGSK